MSLYIHIYLHVSVWRNGVILKTFRIYHHEGLQTISFEGLSLNFYSIEQFIPE